MMCLLVLFCLFCCEFVCERQLLDSWSAFHHHSCQHRLLFVLCTFINFSTFHSYLGISHFCIATCCSGMCNAFPGKVQENHRGHSCIPSDQRDKSSCRHSWHFPHFEEALRYASHSIGVVVIPAAPRSRHNMEFVLDALGMDPDPQRKQRATKEDRRLSCSLRTVKTPRMKSCVR